MRRCPLQCDTQYRVPKPQIFLPGLHLRKIWLEEVYAKFQICLEKLDKPSMPHLRNKVCEPHHLPLKCAHSYACGFWNLYLCRIFLFRIFLFVPMVMLCCPICMDRLGRSQGDPCMSRPTRAAAHPFAVTVCTRIAHISPPLCRIDNPSLLIYVVGNLLWPQ